MLKGCLVAVFVMIASLCAMAAPCAAQAYSTAEANKLLRAQQWPALLDYAQRWTKAEPNDPDAWYYLGQTFSIGFERPADAAEPIRRALALKPAWPQAWNSLGLVETKLKHHKLAMGAFEKATEQAPQIMNYWFNLGSARSELGDFDGAHAALMQGAKIAGPQTGFEDWYNLGIGFARMHDCQNAANAYGQAVQRNPNFADGWNSLGLCREQLGSADAARAAYQQGIRLGSAAAAKNLKALEIRLAQRKKQSEEPDWLVHCSFHPDAIGCGMHAAPFGGRPQ